MSESEELIVVDGPSVFQQPSTQATFKKRELYEKALAARSSKNAVATDLSMSSSEPGPSTQLASSTERSTTTAVTSVATSVLRTARHHSAGPKRDANPVTSFPSAVSSAGPQLAMSSYPFRAAAAAAAAPECKPHPIIFGENIFIECSLLKSNVLLLREALLNPNLQAMDLQAITDDIRKAKEVLVEKVCLPLSDIQRTLQEQMSREHVAAMQSAAHTGSVYGSLGHDLAAAAAAAASLPLAPSALHPYPSHLYLYPVQEPLAERSRAAPAPDASCAPFSAQPAH